MRAIEPPSRQGHSTRAATCHAPSLLPLQLYCMQLVPSPSPPPSYGARLEQQWWLWATVMGPDWSHALYPKLQQGWNLIAQSKGKECSREGELVGRKTGEEQQGKQRQARRDGQQGRWAAAVALDWSWCHSSCVLPPPHCKVRGLIFKMGWPHLPIE